MGSSRSDSNLGLASHCSCDIRQNGRPAERDGSLGLRLLYSYRVLWKISFSGVSRSVSTTQLASPWGQEAAVSSLCTFSPSGIKLRIQWMFSGFWLQKLLISRWWILFSWSVYSREAKLPCHESLTLCHRNRGKGNYVTLLCNWQQFYSQWHIPFTMVVLQPWCCNIPVCYFVSWKGGWGHGNSWKVFKANQITSHITSSLNYRFTSVTQQVYSNIRMRTWAS